MGKETPINLRLRDIADVVSLVRDGGTASLEVINYLGNYVLTYNEVENNEHSVLQFQITGLELSALKKFSDPKQTLTAEEVRAINNLRIKDVEIVTSTEERVRLGTDLVRSVFNNFFAISEKTKEALADFKTSIATRADHLFRLDEPRKEALKKNAIPFLVTGSVGSVAAASIFGAKYAGLDIHGLLAKELSETALPALNDALKVMGIDPLQLSPELSSALSITTLVLGSAVIAGLTTAIYNAAKNKNEPDSSSPGI